MEFTPVKCPNCAGDLMLPEDCEYSICSYCGSKFLLKDAVSKTPAPSVENWLQLAKSALESNNYSESLEYSNRILEVDTCERKAWFTKGVASGYLSTVQKPRIQEMVNSFRKVINLSTPANSLANKNAVALKCKSFLESAVNNQIPQLVETLLSKTLFEARKNANPVLVENEWNQICSYSKDVLLCIDLVLELKPESSETALMGVNVMNSMIGVAKNKYYNYQLKKVKIEKSDDKIQKLQALRSKYCGILRSQNHTTKISKPKKVKKNGCFVVTATMGDCQHPYVITLQEFRDAFLVSNRIGKLFFEGYYFAGPHFANAISRSDILRKISYYLIVKPAYRVARRYLSYISSKKAIGER